MQVVFHAVFIIHTIEDNFSSWFRFTDSWRVIYNGTIKPLQLVIHVVMGSIDKKDEVQSDQLAIGA